MFHNTNTRVSTKVGVQKPTLFKKGQVWYLDVFVAISIIIIIGFLYINHINNTNRNEETTLTSTAQSISNLLMTPGYPLDWNEYTVSIPGIVENFRLNEEKLAHLYNLSENQLPVLFQIDNNIYIEVIQDNQSVEVDGKTYGGRLIYPSAKEVAYVERILLHNNEPAILRTVVWR